MEWHDSSLAAPACKALLPSLFQLLHASFVGRQLASTTPVIISPTHPLQILGSALHPEQPATSQTLSHTQVAAKLCAFCRRFNGCIFDLK